MASTRRPIQFWKTFNNWWRTELERQGRRPLAGEINQWYEDNAELTWAEDIRPTAQETRVHAKCLRSIDAVRVYFRKYRATKRRDPDGDDDDALDDACDEDTEGDSSWQAESMGNPAPTNSSCLPVAAEATLPPAGPLTKKKLARYTSLNTDLAGLKLQGSGNSASSLGPVPGRTASRRTAPYRARRHSAQPTLGADCSVSAQPQQMGPCGTSLHFPAMPLASATTNSCHPPWPIGIPDASSNSKYQLSPPIVPTQQEMCHPILALAASSAAMPTAFPRTNSNTSSGSDAPCHDVVTTQLPIPALQLRERRESPSRPVLKHPRLSDPGPTAPAHGGSVAANLALHGRPSTNGTTTLAGLPSLPAIKTEALPPTAPQRPRPPPVQIPTALGGQRPATPLHQLQGPGPGMLTSGCNALQAMYGIDDEHVDAELKTILTELASQNVQTPCLGNMDWASMQTPQKGPEMDLKTALAGPLSSAPPHVQFMQPPVQMVGAHQAYFQQQAQGWPGHQQVPTGMRPGGISQQPMPHYPVVVGATRSSSTTEIMFAMEQQQPRRPSSCQPVILPQQQAKQQQAQQQQAASGSSAGGDASLHEHSTAGAQPTSSAADTLAHFRSMDGNWKQQGNEPVGTDKLPPAAPSIAGSCAVPAYMPLKGTRTVLRSSDKAPVSGLLTRWSTTGAGSNAVTGLTANVTAITDGGKRQSPTLATTNANGQHQERQASGAGQLGTQLPPVMAALAAGQASAAAASASICHLKQEPVPTGAPGPAAPLWACDSLPTSCLQPFSFSSQGERKARHLGEGQAYGVGPIKLEPGTHMRSGPSSEPMSTAGTHMQLAHTSEPAEHITDVPQQQQLGSITQAAASRLQSLSSDLPARMTSMMPSGPLPGGLTCLGLPASLEQMQAPQTTMDGLPVMYMPPLPAGLGAGTLANFERLPSVSTQPLPLNMGNAPQNCSTATWPADANASWGAGPMSLASPLSHKPTMAFPNAAACDSPFSQFLRLEFDEGGKQQQPPSCKAPMPTLLGQSGMASTPSAWDVGGYGAFLEQPDCGQLAPLSMAQQRAVAGAFLPPMDFSTLPHYAPPTQEYGTRIGDWGAKPLMRAMPEVNNMLSAVQR